MVVELVPIFPGIYSELDVLFMLGLGLHLEPDRIHQGVTYGKHEVMDATC